MNDKSQVLRWHVQPSADAVRDAAVEAIRAAAAQAITERGEFHLVLAGGNTPRSVYEKLLCSTCSWGGWHIYFGDERCLPPNHAERNSGMAYAAWLQHVAIPHMQIYMIPAEMGAVRAAQEYSKVLQGLDLFDLVLLGLGEDGHTASLFPGNDWGAVAGSPDMLAVHDAPKPPPERVSMSASRLSRARQVLFLVTGEGKRAAVTKWRAGEAIPAAAIAPEGGVDVLVESCVLESTAR